MLSSKTSFLKILFTGVTLVSINACERNDKIEKEDIQNVLITNNNEETEVYFFTALANSTQAIIAKSQLAQYKSLEQNTRKMSSKIENNQVMLLQEINKITLKKLIVITDINIPTNDDLYKLIDTSYVSFDKVYINSMTKLLYEQIQLLESISKKTNDSTVSKLAFHYLPIQYKLLLETEKLNELNTIKNTTIIN
ncbi:DUF4142 domain-containing protein [Flavobacterium pectinovorum]|uniref:DUF4142 domain-containing protein n=1 Tax=Flavobacterium pectinovorum TaxID=29533 RepID=UPI001FADBC5F|nr:DUF4142 domain-containing protein [Flavobacterium pectinovorum]MCI9846464.1 DUF4142 domain-containing protein [Flavobacterium pectinovorum]